jgi:hypothetical protein
MSEEHAKPIRSRAAQRIHGQQMRIRALEEQLRQSEVQIRYQELLLTGQIPEGRKARENV